jgi:hypothetical protein
MHDSRSKIPSKNFVRQRCAKGFNSGDKGLKLIPTEIHAEQIEKYFTRECQMLSRLLLCSMWEHTLFCMLNKCLKRLYIFILNKGLKWIDTNQNVNRKTFTGQTDDTYTFGYKILPIKLSLGALSARNANTFTLKTTVLCAQPTHILTYGRTQSQYFPYFTSDVTAELLGSLFHIKYPKTITSRFIQSSKQIMWRYIMLAHKTLNQLSQILIYFTINSSDPT